MSIPAIFAHRGDSGAAPENTMPAFETAVAGGADGVEFDVQATRDGELVVIHDENLLRTARRDAEVGNTALKDLRKLDAGSWFGPEFLGARVPLLAEVLELFRPTAMTVNIELKTRVVPYPGLAPGVVRQVRDMGLGERVVLSSFNHHTLAEARAAAPEIACAVLAFEHLLEPWEYVARHGFQALHPVSHAVTETLVAECHARGLAVRTWVVDEVDEAERLAAMGVDGIVTNQPGRLLAWRNGG